MNNNYCSSIIRKEEKEKKRKRKFINIYVNVYSRELHLFNKTAVKLSNEKKEKWKK